MPRISFVGGSTVVLILLAISYARAQQRPAEADLVRQRLDGLAEANRHAEESLARRIDEQMLFHRLEDLAEVDKVRYTGPPPRVVKNPAYLIVILLSRVVTRLGSVSPITPKVIEDLYAKDLAFLQDLYNDTNRLEDSREDAVCPNCQHEFHTEAAAGVGGSLATPWISSTGR